MSKHWYNNGEIQVFREIKPEGFVAGMLTSSKEKMSKSKQDVSPWNKGLTKETHPSLKHSSEIQKNKVVSEETKMKISENTKLAMQRPEVKSKLGKLKGRKVPKEQVEKMRKTLTGRTLTLEWKQKIGDANRGKHPRKLSEQEAQIKLEKQIASRRKNNTFNTSKKEEDLFLYLKDLYPDYTIYRNYKDKKRYPFYCDFYIKELDLFIELNAHWTHGNKPYNEFDLECQQQLKLWQDKSEISNYFKVAIETWTIRDVKKFQCAKQNNLNYLVIY